MRTRPDLLQFCVIAGTLITMPCASFLHVLARSITQGRRAGLLAVLGLGAGVMLHTTLAVIGVAALTIIVYGLVAYSAGQIGHWLRTHKWAGERVQRVTGGSFVAVGVVALVDGG